MMPSQTDVLGDVRIRGVARRQLIRPEDATLATMKGGHFYLDADDDTFAGGLGHERINGADYFANEDDSTLSIATAGSWNGAPVFVATGTSHYMRLRRVPTLSSYLLVASVSVPQPVVDALNACTLGRRVVWQAVDEVTGEIVASLALFTAANLRGWQFTPKYLAGANNTLTVASNTHPAVLPIADAPMIVAVEFDRETLTSRFYCNDGTRPVAVRANHLDGDLGGGDRRMWVMSNTTVTGFDGRLGKMFMHDNTSPQWRYTPAQRAGLFADWKSFYAIQP